VGSSTTTDVAGNFTLESASPSGGIWISATKDGYVARQVVCCADNTQLVTIKLPPLLRLPIEGSTSSELRATDPPDYVGEAYESDYSYNTRYFAFTTPATAEVIVEAGWEQSEDSTLEMWAFGGTLVSERTGAGALIHLPGGSSGVLLVGRPYSAGRLRQSQSVAFTLRTRRSAGNASP
jgi:hypothetical protein